MTRSKRFVEAIRDYEVRRILPAIPPGSRVLEIGAGAGWQARFLASHGFDVTALEMESGVYGDERVYPIVNYDGHHIPFPDHSFDVVFTSSTLEHIPHVRAFQAEIQRVLAPGGRAIHVLPSGVWRFWQTVCHYLFLAQMLWQSLAPSGSAEYVADTFATVDSLSATDKLKKALIPSRHGEFGNCLTEMYYFSAWRWSRLFRETGWRVVRHYPIGLTYSGFSVVGERIPLPIRRAVSPILGSSTHVFVLTSVSPSQAAHQ